MTNNMTVYPSDIRSTVRVDHEHSRELARKANELIGRLHVTEWELWATDRELVIDGWDADGREVLHARLLGL